MKEQIYKIDATAFEFESAGIIGIITEDQRLCWAIDLYAKPNELDGHEIAPKFSFTLLDQAEDFKYNESFNWKQVAAYNDKTKDWIASFYIYDSHYFIADVDIKKIDNDNFLVSIDGKVNLNWETAPEENFRSFKIKNSIPFNGILSEIDDEQGAFAITKKYFDTEALKWLPKEKTSSGENSWITY